jgi:Mor family transcriptional regulator
MRTLTTERNREIFAGYKAGKTVRQLAENYGLAPATIAGVLAPKDTSSR